ncbi:MAG: hypothetical protein A2201_02805 [Alicyclobacillus sp. RIFOXYA1_FULL_53_8]|nr:MAG: hypothetical protein A2201_02805 [Alicyclobacillus sp. RIFOXYA1_FULL_53_8]
MMKFRPSSPLGLVLAVAGIALALSPETRKAVRRLMVKGTAGVLDAVDNVKHAGAGVMGGPMNRTASPEKEIMRETLPAEDKQAEHMDIELVGDKYVLHSADEIAPKDGIQ